MYTKDKKARITLRLSEKQMNFVVHNSDKFKVCPSDYLRMIINQQMAREECKRRENEQANINNQL